MPSRDLAAAGLVRVRRLVRAGADAVADRVATAGRGSRPRRCPRGHGGRARRGSRPGAAERDRVVVDGGELVEQLLVARRERAGAEVLRVVGPVAVGADPDLEQRRLVLDDRVGGGRRERLDARARPDEREAAARARPARSSPCPRRGRSPATRAAAWAQVMPGPQDALHVLHRRGGDLVREPHPLDLLLGLDRARLGRGAASRRRRRGTRRTTPSGTSSARRPCGRSPACRARARGRRVRTRDAASRARSSARSPGGRGSRCVVAAEEADVLRPGGAGGVLGGRLETDQHRARPRAGRRRRRSPSSPRSSSGRGRCRARGRRARRARCSAMSARTRSSFASSRGQGMR